MNYRESWDLASIPDAEIFSEVARRRSAQRGDNVGGRPKSLSPCEHCGEKHGVAEMRKHRARCPKRPAATTKQ